MFLHGKSLKPISDVENAIKSLKNKTEPREHDRGFLNFGVLHNADKYFVKHKTEPRKHDRGFLNFGVLHNADKYFVK